MSNKVTGLIKGYVKLVGGAAKSTLGGEFVAASGALIKGAKRGLEAKTCPRCHEASLYLMETGQYRCHREDICGWSGSAKELAKASAAVVNIHPLVYSIAKGVDVDMVRDSGRSQLFSWLLWGLSLLVGFYAIYWLVAGRPMFSVWVGLVMFWLCIHAVRYAYRAQYLRGEFTASPKAFLLRPGLWFVT